MSDLKTYRYPFHGWWNVFPATSTEDALREAAKCIYGPIHPELLEVWGGEKYVPVENKRKTMLPVYCGEQVHP